jgi:outer membrane protein OmpA-like peptidoglycan-associated protein/tetratricopeptide (TPR) repeat protein
MPSLKFIIPFLIAFITFSSFKPEDKYLRKAVRQSERGNIKEAKSWFLKALGKNPDNYKANLGLGLLLSEQLNNYPVALSYLEKAFKLSEKDTLVELIYALGKCYLHAGDYGKALVFLNRLNGVIDYDGEIDFEKDLKKRKEDCEYGISNRNDMSSPNWYIINAGKSINTDMPEYVPVLTLQNELIFTSRRKDHRREQVSYLDGKYFESMYISKIDNSGFKEARRYSLPDQFLKSRFRKNHESVVSMSPDGKKLFTYSNNKIFEINMDERLSQKPKKLLKTINFDYYQNHAFLTKDGNTLYFTSEAKGGIGGIDIYKSEKIKEGEWSKPENIGEPINTGFDEDAPFITDDGKTMYFSSNGHEGFGNYDIYKSTYVAGKWTKPENLGQPINSPGQDIFMVQDNKASVGYFSSSRNGGYGDMDIYKINYLNNFHEDCPVKTTHQFSLSIIDTETNDFKNKIEVTLPKNYNVYSYEWKVNEKAVETAKAVLDYDYKNAGSYIVTSKIIAWCDTCLAPLALCSTIENKFGNIKVDTATIVKVKDAPPLIVDLSKYKGELSIEQLQALGFNTSPILFDFDQSDIRTDAREILKNNSEVLKKHPSLKIQIVGYTDSRGSEKHNKKLSTQRANSVKALLSKNEVTKLQINYSTGKGANDLINKCGEGQDCDDLAHQQNRRVVFIVFND